MRLSDFDYNLPKELIAQKPVRPRHSSRLMILNGSGLFHTSFESFTDYLEKGDVLVLNDSKVIPARLFGEKDTGGKVEVLLVKRIREDKWECLARGKRHRVGTNLTFPSGLTGIIREKYDGKYVIEFHYKRRFKELLNEIGEMPTPPYIKRKLVSKDEYQTVYAKHDGSIAAPTAGFHFTSELLDRIKEKGVEVAFLTLHVGLGTFMSVKAEDVEMHRMEEEYFTLDEKNARIINERESRLMVVGTTSIRALESASDDNGKIIKKEGWTDLFIYPGYRFKMDISGLLTNFHLPKSTLLMLVSAYAGKKRILNAYKEAAALSYRFYSFGDAMLILK